MAGDLYANFSSRMLFKWWVFFKKAISFRLGYVSKSLIFVLCFCFFLLVCLFVSFFKQIKISRQKHANVWAIKGQVGQSDRMMEDLQGFVIMIIRHLTWTTLPWTKTLLPWNFCQETISSCTRIQTTKFYFFLFHFLFTKTITIHLSLWYASIMCCIAYWFC